MTTSCPLLLTALAEVGRVIPVHMVLDGSPTTSAGLFLPLGLLLFLAALAEVGDMVPVDVILDLAAADLAGLRSPLGCLLGPFPLITFATHGEVLARWNPDEFAA